MPIIKFPKFPKSSSFMNKKPKFEWIKSCITIKNLTWGVITIKDCWINFRHCWRRHWRWLEAFQAFQNFYHFRSTIGNRIGAILAQRNQHFTEVEACFVVTHWVIDNFHDIGLQVFIHFRHKFEQKRTRPLSIQRTQSRRQFKQHHAETEDIVFRWETFHSYKFGRCIWPRSERSAYLMTFIIEKSFAWKTKIGDFRFKR